MNAARIKFADMPTDYVALVAMHPPRPLHDSIDERNAEEIVMEMAGHQLTSDQDDYLELLSDLLVDYQNRNALMERSRRQSVHVRLKYLLEQSGTTPAKLARLLGCSQPLVSLLLSGKRELSKQNIRKLAAHFKLDANYFL